jgi:hypothetical protein
MGNHSDHGVNSHLVRHGSERSPWLQEPSWEQCLATPFLMVAGFLCGSRTFLGSRLIGGFFLGRIVLSGSCLALLGSGSLLDGWLLRGLFDCLATRR